MIPCALFNNIAVGLRSLLFRELPGLLLKESELRVKNYLNFVTILVLKCKKIQQLNNGFFKIHQSYTTVF